MVELVAANACSEIFHFSVGSVTAAPVEAGCLTTISPYRGQVGAVSAALKSAHGMAFPAPNRSTGKAGSRAIWFGLDQALLMGPAADPSLDAHAALADQSDAWAVVRLEGADAEAVLARLVPVDMRAGRFRRGHTVRSNIQHMSGSITRIGAQAFLVMVFRSMAKTLAHDLKTAMEAVAARG